MYKALTVVMSCVLALTSCIFNTGCSQSKFDSTVKVIQSEIQPAANLAAAIAQLANDPAVAPFANAIAAAGGSDLAAVSNAVDAYFANRSSGNKQAIFSAVQSLVGAVNAQLLAANKVLDPKSQAKALQELAAFSLVISGFEVALAPFFNQTVKAKADFEKVQPFIPRDAQEQMAEAYGYNLGQLGL